ncbi:hypothetical protein PAXINDRAFT_6534 [Paxillus involutus ATCC 200175]|nr:hypothetical protein PAXINDRAFT_6534 [Paxillus involutus ATCC 200175]
MSVKEPCNPPSLSPTHFPSSQDHLFGYPGDPGLIPVANSSSTSFLQAIRPSLSPLLLELARQPKGLVTPPVWTDVLRVTHIPSLLQDLTPLCTKFGNATRRPISIS